MSLQRTESSKQTNLIQFSFCDHKSIYETIFIHPENQEPILEDIKDFWKFVNKYESMLRGAGQPILAEPFVSLDLEEENKFQSFHKRNFIPLKLTYDPRKCFDRYMHRNKDLSILKSQQFSEIVLLYMDFKQKEKFSKIRKLRKSQACLPITKYKNEIGQALKENQVLIVAGDTGCGKSTQIPQYLYQYGYRSIACTQPRRLACVSLSKRVAFEMLDDYGSKVGFQIRFEKNKTTNTNILFITEGLLLRQLAVDSNLDQYDVLILDEIHERNLYGDFLLGVTKCLLRAKRDLKLVLMSATINIELFNNYFKDEGAILIEVPGRLFPIKTVYLPPPALELKRSGARSASVRLDPGPYTQVLNLIDHKYPLTERGDVLIFASGVNEITTICDAAKEYSEKNNHWIILALHSGLSLADQDKVFDYAPERMRKCIVSTNIAETSLTVDGIRFVVDSGKVKEMSYDALSKGQRLKEFWVSKSSAEQRKGRAGRTGPGVCYRIFSEKQFEALEPYPTPEIFRVPLESILLQMISMGLPNVRVFPFIESPTEENIEQTILTLKQHNTLSVDEKITPLGRALSNLPVDITIGKMLLMGCALTDTVDKILTLASMLSVQTPFTSRAYLDKKCTEERLPFESDQGDIFTLLNAYHEWLGLKLDRLENTRKWCYKMGLEEQRFYDIAKLRNQFQNILEINNMMPSRSKDSLSSADRSRRHGEVRALKAIKRKQKYQEPRKRKVLKRSQENEDDFTANTDDIRDVDFRLTYDTKKMETLHTSSEARMHRDVTLLKIIIVSGFYPQISFPDEFNYCKGASQQFFHTHLKQFISIHPNSGFAKTFEILKLNDSDILDKPSYYTPKQPLSTAHQVLCYQNLLETAKVYLMNPIRMPAAQTLLLFSFSIDTNISISRIVCDSWLCLEFPIPETGKELLKRAIQLRYKWSRMLNDKIKDFSNSLDADPMSDRKNTKEDQTELWDDMIAFMDTNVAYTVKRLLPADLKNLYNEQQLDPKVLNPNPFLKNVETVANQEKGGLNLTENVVYGCLRDVQWTIEMDAQMMEHTWECPVCSEVVTMNGINKLIHESNCVRVKEKPKKQEEKKHNIGDTEYTCAKCKKTWFLSAIDILRHKRKC